MSGKRREYTPEFRVQGSCLVGACTWSQTAPVVEILGPCSMPMTVPMQRLRRANAA
jgi:hypothetical protein